MSPNDMKDLIYTAGQVSNKMDESHLKALQSILISAQRSNRCVFFRFMTLKQTIRYLVRSILKQDDILDAFDRSSAKSLYKILGEYNYFPRCALCGKVIDTSGPDKPIKKIPDSPLSFSWDHIFPKSHGGTTHLSNLQPTHKICNNIKSDKIPCECSKNINIDILISSKYKTIRPQIYIDYKFR